MPDYDPYLGSVLDDPHQAYDRLREESPALFLEEYNAWFLARFDYVWEALQRPDLSVAQGISTSQLLLGAPPGPLMPSQMDPPRHTAVRKVLSDSHFRPSRVHGIEDHVRTMAADAFPKVFASTLERLYREPEQRRLVLADPSLQLEAFHEALRIDTPTQFQGRTVTEAFSLDGHRFEPGQRVCFLFASANRDPCEFADPEHYVVERRPNRMVGFGHGTHVCLGLHLARMEARVALQEFLDVVPAYEIDFNQARYARTEYVRGWLRLPVSPSVRSAIGDYAWT